MELARAAKAVASATAVKAVADEAAAAATRKLVAEVKRIAGGGAAEGEDITTKLAGLEAAYQRAHAEQRLADEAAVASVRQAEAHAAPLPKPGWLLLVEASEQWRGVGREDRSAAAEKQATDAFDEEAG